MLRITGGAVYDPSNGINGEIRDLCIADGKFVSSVNGGRTIDATGMVIFPGGVDVHTHVAGGSINFARAMTPEDRITDLRLQLPPPPRPAGLYRPVVIVGPLAYVSGHVPLQNDGTLIEGRVGENLTLEQGQAASRQVGLTILATLKQELSTLNKVQRIIKLFGMVNCTADFREHPQVINGCSELFRDVFGPENGD